MALWPVSSGDSPPCSSARPWPGVSCELGAVTSLDLSGQGLQGPIPDALSWLTALVSMWVCTCSLASANLAAPTSFLTSLLLRSNSSTFCTWTPQIFTYASLLTRFPLLPLLRRDLSNNSLTGTLPPSWSALQDLEALRLDDNALRGPLPSRWAALASLQELTAQSNMLTGTDTYRTY